MDRYIHREPSREHSYLGRMLQALQGSCPVASGGPLFVAVPVPWVVALPALAVAWGAPHHDCGLHPRPRRPAPLGLRIESPTLPNPRCECAILPRARPATLAHSSRDCGLRRRSIPATLAHPRCECGPRRRSWALRPHHDCGLRRRSIPASSHCCCSPATRHLPVAIFLHWSPPSPLGSSNWLEPQLGLRFLIKIKIYKYK